MAATVIVNSALRERIKSLDPEIRVGGDLIEGLDEIVTAQLKVAIERVKTAKRKTVGKGDLTV